MRYNIRKKQHSKNKHAIIQPYIHACMIVWMHDEFEINGSN